SADEAGESAADRPGNGEEQGGLPRRRRRRPPPSDGSAVAVDAMDRCDKTVAVLGDGFDEARPGGVVAKLAPQRPYALGQRFVGDRDAAPDFIEEAVLGHEPALLAHQQRKRIKIAAVELDSITAAPQLAVFGIKDELLKDEASGHFSAKPHVLLMPFTGRDGRPEAAVMHGETGMATEGEVMSA